MKTIPINWQLSRQRVSPLNWRNIVCLPDLDIHLRAHCKAKVVKGQLENIASKFWELKWIWVECLLQWDRIALSCIGRAMVSGIGHRWARRTIHINSLHRTLRNIFLTTGNLWGLNIFRQCKRALSKYMEEKGKSCFVRWWNENESCSIRWSRPSVHNAP